MKQPNIETKRLFLRPYHESDSAIVAELAGDIKVAETTLNIPHPYNEENALNWISRHEERWLNRSGVAYAIILKPNLKLVGTVSLDSILDGCAELGYWVGYEYWNRGYCSEAARALVNSAFESFPISTIIARHLADNPASGKVMKNIGMVKNYKTIKPNRDGLLSEIEVYKLKCNK